MIFCSNEICAYWKELHCVLDSITVGPAGLCMDCTLVTIPKAQLDPLRAALLASLNDDER